MIWVKRSAAGFRRAGISDLTGRGDANGRRFAPPLGNRFAKKLHDARLRAAINKERLAVNGGHRDDPLKKLSGLRQERRLDVVRASGKQNGEAASRRFERR